MNYMLQHTNICRLMFFVVDMIICKVIILEIYKTLNDIVGICFTERKNDMIVFGSLVLELFELFYDSFDWWQLAPG